MSEWNRFAKIIDGTITRLIFSEQSEIEGLMDVTGRDDAVIGALYDAGTDTFEAPYAVNDEITRALLLIVRAAIQEGIIPLSIVPQEAKDIWQKVKENRQ